jgi:hypothetical protein
VLNVLQGRECDVQERAIQGRQKRLVPDGYVSAGKL